MLRQAVPDVDNSRPHRTAPHRTALARQGQRGKPVSNLVRNRRGGGNHWQPREPR